MASPNANVSTPVPFPQPEFERDMSTAPTPNSPHTSQRRERTSTNASMTSISKSLRTASVKLMETNPPPGMWAATGSSASKAPTLAEIRRGSFSQTGWNDELQRAKAERRASQPDEGSKWSLRRSSSGLSGAPDSPARPPLGKSPRTGSSGAGTVLAAEQFPVVAEEDMGALPPRETVPGGKAFGPPLYDNNGKKVGVAYPEPKESSEVAETEKIVSKQPPVERQFSNGYIPPPKVPWTTSTLIGLKAFWKWFLTPAGFLITVYGLNVVAWGGMLFLLLCNAAPAMCKPSCDDIQSPRRIWIEIDSQILNSLFCVTGFGLAPWRFRDLYWWGWWRLGGSKRKEIGIRRLAGIHRGWFRLPGSDMLPPNASAKNVAPEDPAVPIPVDKTPDPPPTGIHAPPTDSWKIDFVLWMNAWNTFFQIVLCFYMWHYNRYERPSWATGTFVALGCIVAGIGGIMMYHEGKYVKKVEGVPTPKGYEDGEPDVERLSAQTLQNEPATTLPAVAAKS